MSIIIRSMSGCRMDHRCVHGRARQFRHQQLICSALGATLPSFRLIPQREWNVKLNYHPRLVGLLISRINGSILILYCLQLNFPNLSLSFRQGFQHSYCLLMCCRCDVSLVFLDLIALIKRDEVCELQHSTLWHFL
jgi:hypothetical protein